MRSSKSRDVTEIYARMIEAMENDFNLAAEPDNGHGLDELQIMIENGDARMLADIRLLQRLSFGIRNGHLKIIETPIGTSLREALKI